MTKSYLALLFIMFLSTAAAVAEDYEPAQHTIAAAISSHRYDDALRLVGPLLQTHERDPALWTLQGLALDGLGRMQESMSSFDEALSINNVFAPALQGASQTTYLHGDSRAPQYVQRLLSVEPANEVAHAMAGALDYLSQNCPGSINHFEQSHMVVYQDARALSEFADCLLKTQAVAQAIQVLSRASELYPSSAQLKYNLAVAELRNQDPTAAITVLAPLASAKDPELLNLLASAYTQAHRPDDAFNTLENAIELSPIDESNYLDLAILCLDHHQENRSIAAATAGIARIPKAASLYLIRGVAYAQLASYSKAEEDFTTAATIEPDQPHSMIAMSLLYSDRNQLDKEQALLRKQLSLTPNDAVANYLLADLLIRSGAQLGQLAFDEAHASLSKSIAAKPDSAEAQVLMGRILEQKADLAGALTHFKAALSLEPDSRPALNHEYLILRKLHRDDEALIVVGRLRSLLNNELKHDTDSGRVRLDPASATTKATSE